MCSEKVASQRPHLIRLQGLPHYILTMSFNIQSIHKKCQTSKIRYIKNISICKFMFMTLINFLSQYKHNGYKGFDIRGSDAAEDIHRPALLFL